MTQQTWEMLAGHYGLTGDDLIYILDRKIEFNDVQKICEYWECCFKEGYVLETFREADKAFQVFITQSQLLDSQYS